MSIILKKTFETFDRIYFELPQEVEYFGKKCSKFSMNSPANLIRALRANGNLLCDILVGKEVYRADWRSAKIERKKIVVNKFETRESREAAIQLFKLEKKATMSFRDCAICGARCKKSKKMIGCCSDACFQKKLALRNESVSKTHWCKSSKFEEITLKRVARRKRNDETLSRKYAAWNSGKTGIYSLETIEKIKAATRSQFHREIFKKTSIEKRVDELLKEAGIKYKYSFILCGRQFDFVVNDKFLIELHGDFWHGNPKIYGPGLKDLRDHQIMKRLDDKIKQRIACEQGYVYVELWEYDINNNWDTVKSRILEMINGN